MVYEGVIRSERLTVRSYRPEDLSFVCALWLDEENGRYLSDPDRAHVDQAFQKALDGLYDSPYGYYFVAENACGTRVGTCCAFPDDTGKVYDIGYCVDQKFWRQGYGQEIVTALEGWIFARGGEKITAEVAVENLPSNRLLQKLGYAVEQETEFQKYNMDITFPGYLYGKTK